MFRPVIRRVARRLHLLLAAACLSTASVPASAQTPGVPSAAADRAVADGPALPPLPDVVARDAQGNVTMRAVRLPSPMQLDGTLDELFYQSVHSASDFVQQEPAEGQPATDRTEVWVFVDDRNLYVSARLWESVPGRRVTSDMRRDSPNLYNNDHFALILDTFHDRRNGFGLSSNSQGAMFDWVVTNEQPNNNWNPIWFSRTADFEGGWSIEIRVPFRSMRLREGADEWGVNFRRMVRWKNEVSYLHAVPRSWGRRGLSKLSSAATLVGVGRPARSINLDVKPYVLGSSLTTLSTTPAVRNDAAGDWGVDAKWGITQSLIADLTYNTDFAQVEDDEQQVNLTRFSLFFPERREFFLEGQDIFSFGGTGGGGGGGQPGGGGFAGGGGGPGLSNPNAPILFFSRRIGLDAGSVVPIQVGSRLLGRAGPYNVGALAMRTDRLAATGKAPTNFSALRVTRDVFSRSRVGIIGTLRDPRAGTGLTGQASTLGADGVFNLYDNVQVVSSFARTDTPGRTGDQTSYRGAYAWGADRWGVQADHLHVGRDFNPEVGFLRRRAFDRSYGQFRFSPRPARGLVRKHYFEASYEYIVGPTQKLESREAQLSYRTEFNSGDFFSLEQSDSYEGLTEAFSPGTGVTIPVGNFRFAQTRAGYSFGPQRPVNGTLTAAYGGFYGGTLAELTWRGRVEASPVLLIEPTYSWNRARTPYGDFTTQLAIGRITWTLSPRRFVSALVQYQSATHTVSTNARFRWEYTPGSELFIVYSDGRATLAPGFFPALDNRSLVVKLTRLFRW